MRPSVHERAVEFPQTRTRLAQFSGTSRDQVEYRLRVVRRIRHRLQHIDGGSLLLDPLAELAVALRQRRGARLQLVIRFSTADRDDRLLGKRSQELDLSIGETARRPAAKRNGADRLAGAQHRHANNGPDLRRSLPPKEVLGFRLQILRLYCLTR